MPDKLKKLQEILKQINEGLTRQDFELAFKKVLEIVLKMQKKNEETSEALKSIYNSLMGKIQNDYKKDSGDLKTWLGKELKKYPSIMNSLKTEIDERMAMIRDGKDADETLIVENVLLKIPKDTSKEIRDKLEKLDGKERLKIEAIDELKEKLEELGKVKTQRFGGGGFSKIAMDSHFVDDETPSGTVNGVNTVFVLANTPNPTASLKVFLNGQKMKLGEDYTFNGRTITFLTAPPTGSIILCDYRI